MSWAALIFPYSQRPSGCRLQQIQHLPTEGVRRLRLSWEALRSADLPFLKDDSVLLALPDLWGGDVSSPGGGRAEGEGAPLRGVAGDEALGTDGAEPLELL